MDQPTGTAHSLQMTAMLVSANFRIDPKSGDPSYALIFVYPSGYDEYLKQLSAGAADLYINGVLAGQSVKIVGLTMKPETADEDAEYRVKMKLDGGDAMRFHIGSLAPNPAVELRMVSTQMPLFSQ